MGRKGVIGISLNVLFFGVYLDAGSIGNRWIGK